MGQLTNKRIIIVLPGLALSGAERQALLLAQYLKEKEQAYVEVWGLGHPGRVSELCDTYNIPWRSMLVSRSPRWSIRVKSLLKFAVTLRQAKPEIILPFTMRPNVVCGLFWRFTGAKVCIWNQRDEGRSAGIEHWLQQLAVFLTPRFISNSEHGKDFLVRNLKVHPTNVSVIYNGVVMDPPQQDRRTYRTQLALSESCFVACMAAGLRRAKDHVTLLRAWRLIIDQLIATNTDAVLLLAGAPGDTAQQLHDLVNKLQLDQHVRFVGEVVDITGLFDAVDLCVFSSRIEGCPNGVLEAMAVGLAVVATDIPGIREAVGPNGCSYLAQTGNENVMAQKILELISHPKSRQTYGAANRQRIEQLFTPQRMYQETTKVIVKNLHLQC